MKNIYFQSYKDENISNSIINSDFVLKKKVQMREHITSHRMC